MASLPCSTFSQRPNLISLPINPVTARKTTGSTPLRPNLHCILSRIQGWRRITAVAVGGDAAKAQGQLRPELMPNHVALIVDGHKRWAKMRGHEVEYGHNALMAALKTLVLKSCDFGIKVLTVYVFSTQNWTRSQAEVDFLLGRIESFIRSDVMDLISRYNIRFTAIGHKSRLPESLQSAIFTAEEVSHSNGGMHFLLAVGYGGRHEIVEACKKLAAQVRDGAIAVDDINENLLDQQMMTHVITTFKDPDLYIRTGDELRVSNFLLWQLSYTEFYFSNKLFPDFDRTELVQALLSYQGRDRRFGTRSN